MMSLVRTNDRWNERVVNLLKLIWYPFKINFVQIDFQFHSNFQASTSQSSSENDDGPVAKLAKYTDELTNEICSARNYTSPPKRKSNGKSPINKSDVSTSV